MSRRRKTAARLNERSDATPAPESTDPRSIPIWPAIVIAALCGAVYYGFGSTKYKTRDDGRGGKVHETEWVGSPRTSSYTHHSLTANAWLHGRLYSTHEEVDRQYLVFWFTEAGRPPSAETPTAKLREDYNRIQIAQRERKGYPQQRIDQELAAVQGRPFHDFVHVNEDGEDRYYAYWPPLPAILMLPLVAISGPQASDVLMTNLIGVATALFTFLLLREFKPWWPQLTTACCAGLTLLYGLGTVQFWQSSLGQVWFLTQVSGTLFLIIAMWLGVKAMREPRWIIAAGVAIGVAFLGRLTIVLAGPFFAIALLIGVRNRADWIRQYLINGVGFMLPVIVIIAGQLAFNKARFGEYTEFGQGKLTEETSGGNPIFTKEYKAFGRFHPHYLNANLFNYFVDVRTRMHSSKGWLSFHPYGNSLFAISPALLFLFLCWRRGERGGLGAGDSIVMGLFALIAMCVLMAGPSRPPNWPVNRPPPAQGDWIWPNVLMAVLITAAWIVCVVQIVRRMDLMVMLVLAGLLPGTIMLMLFHGTGFYTFGPRYLLDTLIFFVILAGFGMRGRLTPVAATLIGASIAVNFWGTYHFAMEQF